MRLTAQGKTDRGLVRANNEDRYHLDETLGLLVVADGMGGHASGEIASQLAVHIIRDSFQGEPGPAGPDDPACSPASNRLKRAIVLANQAVYEAAQSSPQYQGMGTTIVAVLLTGNRASIAHIGDSRVYLARGGGLEQLTDDHSVVMEQVRKELISSEEAARSQMRNVLTKALGIAPDMEPDLQEMTIFDGDVLLLCSDGLHGMIDDDEILRIVGSGEDPAVACDSLIARALENGGADNVTVVLGAVRKKKWYEGLTRFLASFRR
ncbi:MAG TPA: Stp1/IreP family PP2C-type Ser/Thr phosphatase [Magnetospirillaceae bacterium]|nr:Stp1/IreP family PP2C-type Ser/Thr phosphatase [Magnetospirillaceae bacterium]